MVRYVLFCNTSFHVLQWVETFLVLQRFKPHCFSHLGMEWSHYIARHTLEIADNPISARMRRKLACKILVYKNETPSVAFCVSWAFAKSRNYMTTNVWALYVYIFLASPVTWWSFTRNCEPNCCILCVTSLRVVKHALAHDVRVVCTFLLC